MISKVRLSNIQKNYRSICVYNADENRSPSLSKPLDTYIIKTFQITKTKFQNRNLCLRHREKEFCFWKKKMVTFAIVGPNDIPLYILGEEGAKVREDLSLSLSTYSKRKTYSTLQANAKFAHLNQFILHASLDIVHEKMLEKTDTYVIVCVYIFFVTSFLDVVQVLERCRSVQWDYSLCICHSRWCHFPFTSQEEKLLSVPNLFREGSWVIRQGIFISFSSLSPSSKTYTQFHFGR